MVRRRDLFQNRLDGQKRRNRVMQSDHPCPRRILIDGGYRLVRGVSVDQFLFSAEIEAVATFERL